MWLNRLRNNLHRFRYLQNGYITMKEEKITFQDCFKHLPGTRIKPSLLKKPSPGFSRRLNSLTVKILSEVKRIDNGRLDIPVYFSVCTDEARVLTGTKKQMGKGASPYSRKPLHVWNLLNDFRFFPSSLPKVISSEAITVS